jgi:hypothetical protein
MIENAATTNNVHYTVFVIENGYIKQNKFK